MCGVAWSAESISVRAVRIFFMRAHSDWLAASRQSGERLFHGSVLRRPDPDRDRLILFWWRKLPHFLCDSSSRARPCDADLPGRALDRGATLGEGAGAANGQIDASMLKGGDSRTENDLGNPSGWNPASVPVESFQGSQALEGQATARGAATIVWGFSLRTYSAVSAAR